MLAMSLWAILLTGLLAGGASCAAVQGGLLASLLARRRPQANTTRTPQRPMVQSPTTFWDDLFPISMFLSGKLVAHIVLGAALGLVGATLQMNAMTRAVLQIGAGVVMFVLALDILGVHSVRRFVPTMPTSWGRFARKKGRNESGIGPALLGVASILIPCGVTLSMEFLAIASGSPLRGAAIMGTFVLGTVPLFTVLGFLAKKSTTAFRGRLVPLTGIAVAAVALFTINAGLEVMGAPISASAIRGEKTESPANDKSATNASATGKNSPSANSSSASSAPPASPNVRIENGVQIVELAAKNNGYSPSTLRVRSGIPTQLVVTTNNITGCAQGFVFRQFNIDETLPRTGDTTFELGTLTQGKYKYSCSMGMYTGRIEATA